MPRLAQYVWFLLGATSAPAVAQDAPTSFQTGTKCFAEGQQLVQQGKDGRAAFRKATEAFLAHQQAAKHSAGNWQNVGNAAYLAGDLPQAIAAFRSGLVVDPHDPVLRENLAYARAQVQYPPGERGRAERDAWPAWLPRLQPRMWLGVGFACYASAWFAGATWRVRRHSGRLMLSATGFALTAVSGHALLLLHQQTRHNRDVPPVIFKYDAVPLRTGNGASYSRHSELPILHRGMEARLLNRRGDWLRIAFSGGDIGWIRCDDAIVVAVGP